MEVAEEASKISKRGIMDATKDAEFKAATANAAAKAANSISSVGTSSAATTAATTASVFAKAPTYTSSVVGVARRGGYKLIIIML